MFNYRPIIIVLSLGVALVLARQIRNRKRINALSAERILRREGEAKFKKINITLQSVLTQDQRACAAIIDGQQVKVGQTVTQSFILRAIRPEVGNTWACEFDYLTDLGVRVKIFNRLYDDEQAYQWAKEDGKKPEDPYGHNPNARQGISENDETQRR